MLARVLFVAAIGLAADPHAAFAQSGANAMYLQGRVEELPKKKPGLLLASDKDVLAFTWPEGKWTVPFSQITTVYVSLTRRSGDWTEAFRIPRALAAGKLLLSLTLVDEDGKRRNCVFFLPLAPPAEFLDALEEKTSRDIIYESEAARQATIAPRVLLRHHRRR